MTEYVGNTYVSHPWLSANKSQQVGGNVTLLELLKANDVTDSCIGVNIPGLFRGGRTLEFWGGGLKSSGSRPQDNGHGKIQLISHYK